MKLSFTTEKSSWNLSFTIEKSSWNCHLKQNKKGFLSWRLRQELPMLSSGGDHSATPITLGTTTTTEPLETGRGRMLVVQKSKLNSSKHSSTHITMGTTTTTEPLETKGGRMLVVQKSKPNYCATLLSHWIYKNSCEGNHQSKMQESI